jgi:hypothetical protein
MTLPASGSSISMSQINTELGRSSTATISLDSAENGTYVAINTCGPNYPLAANPASLSEWYSYNHAYPCGPPLNSYYALGDGGNPNTQNMLYSNTLSYGGTVSTSRPNPTFGFSYSFWLKRIAGTDQGYLYGLENTTTAAEIKIYWVTAEDPNAPGNWWSYIYFNYTNASGGGFAGIGVNLADSVNTAITGVADNAPWDNVNTGFVNANGYSLISIVYDYNYFGTDDFIKVYWNDQPLTAPWGAVGNNGDSGVNGDSIVAPSWSDAVQFVGGSVPSELSSGCLLDGFAIYTTVALDASQISSNYNGGTFPALSAWDHGDFMFYNFESASPNIGIDTGAYYGLHLDEFNSPVQDPDHA